MHFNLGTRRSWELNFTPRPFNTARVSGTYRMGPRIALNAPVKEIRIHTQFWHTQCNQFPRQRCRWAYNTSIKLGLTESVCIRFSRTLLFNYYALSLLSRGVQHKNVAVNISTACCNTENTHIWRTDCTVRPTRYRTRHFFNNFTTGWRTAAPCRNS